MSDTIQRNHADEVRVLSLIFILTTNIGESLFYNSNNFRFSLN